MEGEAGDSPSIARKRVRFAPRPIGHDWVYSEPRDGEAARETQPPRSLSRSDGESAQAPPAYRGAPFAADRPAPSAELTVAITVGAGRQAVQDTIGSTPDGGSKCRPRLP